MKNYYRKIIDSSSEKSLPQSASLTAPSSEGAEVSERAEVSGGSRGSNCSRLTQVYNKFRKDVGA